MDGLSIKNIGPVSSPTGGGLSSIKPTGPSTGPSFADTLKNAINDVNELQQISDTKIQQLATGETTDIQDVKIAEAKADIALRLMTSVRNKMIDAYHEIMKMQV
jgi:flagellar hook-basal body complex protein FliE